MVLFTIDVDRDVLATSVLADSFVGSACSMIGITILECVTMLETYILLYLVALTAAFNFCSMEATIVRASDLLSSSHPFVEA